MKVRMGYIWKQEWAICGSNNRLYIEVRIYYNLAVEMATLLE